MFYEYPINLNDLNNSLTQMILAVAENSRVLEIGCATGYVGEQYAARNCTVFGLEYDEEMHRRAENRGCYQQVFRLDLNDLPSILNLGIGPVDYIVLGDVIEHVLYPAQVIEHLKTYLSETGTFVFSIPNISHGCIKLNLLLNNFNYTPRGLLDATHIKFFTIKNICSLMIQLGLEMLAVERIYMPLHLPEQPVDPASFPPDVYEFVRSDLESYVYQYIVKARRSLTSQKTLALFNDSFMQPSKSDYLNCNRLLGIFL